MAKRDKRCESEERKRAKRGQRGEKMRGMRGEREERNTKGEREGKERRKRERKQTGYPSNNVMGGCEKTIKWRGVKGIYGLSDSAFVNVCNVCMSVYV